MQCLLPEIQACSLLTLPARSAWPLCQPGCSPHGTERADVPDGQSSLPTPSLPACMPPIPPAALTHVTGICTISTSSNKVF